MRSKKFISTIPDLFKNSTTDLVNSSYPICYLYDQKRKQRIPIRGNHKGIYYISKMTIDHIVFHHITFNFHRNEVSFRYIPLSPKHDLEWIVTRFLSNYMIIYNQPTMVFLTTRNRQSDQHNDRQPS